MFPVDSWETFLQFWPLASQIWLVRTLLSPLRVTPLWLAWPTLRVWLVPSRCSRRSRPTVMGCFAPLGRGLVAGGVSFVGRGLHRLPIFLSPLRGWGKPHECSFSRFAPLRGGTTKQPRFVSDLY